MVNRIPQKTLEIMSEIKEYNAWIYLKIKPFVKAPILEVGAGIGNMTVFFRNKETLCSDIDASNLKKLKKRFLGNKNISVLEHDITKHSRKIHSNYFGSAVLLNVLEHIKDDRTALRNINRALKKDGLIVLQVPTIKFLYSSLDREVLHFRRYSKKQLISALRATNFRIERCFYMNFIGIFGWFLNGRILKRKMLPKGQLKVFNRLVPFFRWLESKRNPPIGLSLMVVARKKK